VNGTAAVPGGPGVPARGIDPGRRYVIWAELPFRPASLGIGPGWQGSPVTVDALVVRPEQHYQT